MGHLVVAGSSEVVLDFGSLVVLQLHGRVGVHDVSVVVDELLEQGRDFAALDDEG